MGCVLSVWQVFTLGAQGLIHLVPLGSGDEVL